MGDTMALMDWLVEEEVTRTGHEKKVLKEALERRAQAHDLLTELLRSI